MDGNHEKTPAIDAQGDKSDESSPDSIVGISSDSWEKVHSGSDHRSESPEGMLHRKTSTSSPEFVDKESSSLEKLSSGDMRTSSSGSSYGPPTSSGKQSEEFTTGHTEKQSSYIPKRTFDPRSTIEEKIFRPLQQIFYRKSTVTEKSSLVKNEVTGSYEEDEIIMPQLPDPSSSYSRDQYELPEGIGTGSGRRPTMLQIEKEEDEGKKRASKYRDAAKGLLMSFLGAGVMYGLTAVLVRLAGEEGINPVAVMFTRSIFQAVLFGSVLQWKKIGWRPPQGRTMRLILISIAYVVGSICSYEAFDVIPPGSAVATRGAARTVFSIAFAYLVLREGVTAGDVLGLLCCFAGIALIITSGMTSGDKDYIQPEGLSDNATIIRIYGYGLLIASAIGRSLGHVGVRGAKDDLNTLTVVFYHSSLTIFFAGILLGTVRTQTWPPSWTGVAYVAIICVASAIATFASNQAVKYAHPALVSFGQNADVVVSLTLEHILLRRSPRPMELGGVLTIFTGLCGLTLYKWMQSKKYNGEHQRLK